MGSYDPWDWTKESTDPNRIRRGWTAFFLAVLIGLAAMGVAAWLDGALGQVLDDGGHTHRTQAHENFWINDSKYKRIDENGNPAEHCCGPGDCSIWPLKQTRVHQNGDIDLLNPDGSLFETVPAREVQQSEDHDAWRCTKYDKKSRRCFFYPIGGV